MRHLYPFFILWLWLVLRVISHKNIHHLRQMWWCINYSYIPKVDFLSAIHRSAQSAFFLTYGIVSIALNKNSLQKQELRQKSYTCLSQLNCDGLSRDNNLTLVYYQICIFLYFVIFIKYRNENKTQNQWFRNARTQNLNECKHSVSKIC